MTDKPHLQENQQAPASSPAAAPPRKTRFQAFVQDNTPFRLAVTALLVLLLLIPLSMVESVVGERSVAYQGVLNDIGSHWGFEQVLTGPILVVPYLEVYDVTETVQDKAGNTTYVKRQVSQVNQAVVLPKKVHLDGHIDPEYRRRGIYQSLVYAARLTLTGSFAGIETQVRRLSDAQRLHHIDWDKAFIVVGLSDTKGIASAKPLRFGARDVALAPGTRVPQLIATGFHALLTIGPIENETFRLEMQIKGSQGFRLSPVGEQSEMVLSSEWAHPSFYGDLLPSVRKISDKGFEAKWFIPHLVRSYPQSWVLGQGDTAFLSSFSAGVRLFEPVTLYTEATRAVKYGTLFIVLTFLTLVLMELVAHVRPSMVQYVIIGVALSLFFLLLIALSEHIGFNKAYALAAACVVGMNTLYCLAVLSRKSLALVVMTVLTALYAVLFMVLRAEDYALLTGSLLLLVALAVTMYFTRRLNQDRGES